MKKLVPLLMFIYFHHFWPMHTPIQSILEFVITYDTRKINIPIYCRIYYTVPPSLYSSKLE